jgi:cytochrome P450
MDAPEHARYREALAPAFDEERIAALEPACRRIAADLLDALVGAADAPFMDDFVTPYSLRALCAFLGWPERQWECLGGWTHGNQQVAFTRDRVAGRALASLLNEHVLGNLEAHRSAGHAGNDVTDALLAARVDGQPLTDEQIVSAIRNWTAGHGTVAAALSILVLHLAETPELQDLLRSDSARIPAAIEEILRADGPLVANRRTTAREVEIGARTIPAGESLSLMWIAANRDPATFDDAGDIQLDRHTDEGLLWGRGIHVCLGAPLARLELRVALEELLARTSRFVLSAEAARRVVYPSNGLETLPLHLSI